MPTIGAERTSRGADRLRLLQRDGPVGRRLLCLCLDGGGDGVEALARSLCVRRRKAAGRDLFFEVSLGPTQAPLHVTLEGRGGHRKVVWTLARQGGEGDGS